MSLSKKNLKLLEKCLKKWYENLMILQLNYLSKSFNLDLFDDVRLTWNSCAFCLEYIKFDRITNCKGCPIYKAVEHLYCCYTPYNRVCELNRVNNHNYKEIFKAISDEINFLESLKD
jgi:hypothetical protein